MQPGLSQAREEQREEDGDLYIDPDSRDESDGDEPIQDSFQSPADFNANPLEEASFSFSEDDLIPSNMDFSGGPFNASSSYSSASFFEKDPDLLYSKTGDDTVEARITVQRTLVVSEPREQRHTAPPPLQSQTQINEERKGRRMSRSITALGRRSKSGSRASDILPAGNSELNSGRVEEIIPRSYSNRSESTKRRKSRPPTARTDDQDAKSARSFLSRKGSKFSKKSQEPASVATPPAESADPPPPSPQKRPATSSGKAVTTTTGPSAPKTDRQSNKIPPLPGTVLRRAQQKTFSPMAKRTDELHSVLRTLDSDYTKFESKPANQKAAFVRSSLNNFLQNYENHASSSNLTPEDLERRVQILSKWWNGLLDMLDGKSGEQLSSLDRPAVLEGLSGLMERVEWRQPLSEFSPLAKQAGPEPPSADPQATQTSEGSDFLLESVHHNTRNLFVHYLFRQMSFVVEKMSWKTTTATLVTFSGKCCAYAMFFCPGMADMLVRLWEVSARNIRRAANSMGAAAPSIASQTSQRILQAFPKCMHPLTFSSYRSTVETLRKKPVLPMGFEKIPWRGGWIDRWCGKESDLFYVFVRQFHVLVVEFLPRDHSIEEAACAPIHVLVRAQILANIDSTLRRYEKPGSGELIEGSAPSSFDEMLNGDGSALGLPPIPPNAARLIKSNRFITLMRTFLSETSPSEFKARKLFADCVCETLQAATKATSLFDQGACLAICDFLEEALAILGNFEESNRTTTSLDWDFWIAVFIRMAQSDNTLTMIRVIAFLYTTWPTIACDAGRKKKLCSEFLLDPEIFMSQFNHWCPMVRSYFMRLLSWRVGRCDEDHSEDDFEIIKMLFDRVLETWAFFQFYLDEAVDLGYVLPSTAPCNPAPGRRLLIIRTDRPVVSTPLFDSPSVAPSPSGAPSRPDSSESRGSPNTSNGFSAAVLLERLSSTLEQSVDSGKRKSAIFRTLSGLRSSESRSPLKDSTTDSPPVESSEPEEATSPSEPSSRASLYEQRPPWPMGPSENAKTLGPKKPKSGRDDFSLRSIGLQTLAEFRFSIEASDRRPNRLPKDMTLSPPKLPRAAQSLLRTLPDLEEDVPPTKPTGAAAANVRYSGRALAEWNMVVNECQNFFERRRTEGVTARKFVETPIMSPEPFKRL